MTEKRLIRYKCLANEDEEITRILFEIVETGEEIEGYVQINKWINDLYKENMTLNKENEQLKKQLECSREESDDYCEELMGKDEFVRLYKKQRDDALKENEQLKSDNNRLVNETAKIIAEHQRKVFDLIDEKIEKYSPKYELYNTNAIEVLEKLKKEL